MIDFGVAKALGQELTDKTLFTGFAQMIGTPLYMSPEQAGMSGLDVDTRSDIYSPGRAAVRAADRHDAVRPRSGSGRRPTTRSAGSSARRSRPGRARGCRRRSGQDRRVTGSISAKRRHRAGEADEAGPRRAGLDRDEGAGEGPQPPLRDRQRLRGGRAAVPGGRAGAGVPAVGLVSPAEVRAAEQGAGVGGVVDLAGPGRWRDRHDLGPDSGGTSSASSSKGNATSWPSATGRCKQPTNRNASSTSVPARPSRRSRPKRPSTNSRARRSCARSKRTSWTK